MRWRGRQSMNSKWLGENFPATFDARSADLTGLKMRRITRGVSFNNLVGAGEQRWRHFEAKRLGSLHVDHQFDLDHLLDRQIGWLLPLEDAAGIDADLAMGVRNAGPIAHQTASRGKFAIRGDRGHHVLEC